MSVCSKSSSTLHLNDLNNIIRGCGGFYGNEKTKEAVKKLQDWYNEEAFDDDDLTNDWIPNDYKNCDGIHIFINNLNYVGQINDDYNKKIVFDWCCYWLLQNVPKPSIQPIAAPNEKTKPSKIEQVGNIIIKELQSRIDEFAAGHEANKISQCFVEICNEEDYTEMNELKSDLENFSDSFIMDEMMRKLPEYDSMKHDIFETLQLVIFDNYPPFDPTSFKLTFTKSTFNVTNMVCSKEISTVYREINDEMIPQNEDCKQLMCAKAIDFENRFPVLSCLMDTFSRYCAYSNRKYWNEHRPKPKADLESIYDIRNKDVGNTMNVEDWFVARSNMMGTFCNHIHNDTNKGYIGITSAQFLKVAVAEMFRHLPTLNYDHVLGATIFDEYDSFAKIICAMNKWVYQQTMEKHKKHEECNYFPMQIDLCIIPRLVRSGVYHTTFLEELDDDGQIESLSKQRNDIWSIEDNLQYKYRENEGDAMYDAYDDVKDGDDWKDGYMKGKEYFVSKEMNIDNEMIDNIKECIDRLWKQYNNRWKEIRYKRYVLIIDRRNPQHIKNKKMVDDTHQHKTWNDTMYLFCPKKCGTISKRYAFVLNECFVINTRDYLFPMPGDGIYCNDFCGSDSGNGYKFLVSYHLYFRNKIKMYWHSCGVQRFFIDDINWLWPRYFKTRDDKNTFSSFQTLSEHTKSELHKIINQYQLEDKDFQQFLKTANLYNQLILGQ